MTSPLIKYLKENDYFTVFDIHGEITKISLNKSTHFQGYMIHIDKIKPNEMPLRDKFHYLVELKNYIKDSNNYVFLYFVHNLKQNYAFIPIFNFTPFDEDPVTYRYVSNDLNDIFHFTKVEI